MKSLLDWLEIPGFVNLGEVKIYVERESVSANQLTCFVEVKPQLQKHLNTSKSEDQFHFEFRLENNKRIGQALPQNT